MQLLTKQLRRQLPSFRAIEDDPNPVVQARFFFPASHWSWYPMSFDGHDIFFGFVDGDFPELGSFSLSELLSVRDQLGLPIERDRCFKRCRLSELRAQLGR